MAAHFVNVLGAGTEKCSGKAFYESLSDASRQCFWHKLEKCSKETLLGAFCDRTRRSYSYQLMGSVRKRQIPAHFAGQCVVLRIKAWEECSAEYLQSLRQFQFIYDKIQMLWLASNNKIASRQGGRNVIHKGTEGRTGRD